MPAQLVLASASPRRLELLEKVGFSVKAMPAIIDESQHLDEMPDTFVKRVARAKVLSVVDRIQQTLYTDPEQARIQRGLRRDVPLRWVLGADTVVVIDNEVVGKPSDHNHAVECVNIKPHKLFEREGSNLYCRVPIPMTTASLGGDIQVGAIDGSRNVVKIPAGTQTGQQFRLKSKGMSIMRSDSFGDMFIEIFVETPVNLSSKQKDMMKQFADDLDREKSGHSPESESFMKKMKDLWSDLKN